MVSPLFFQTENPTRQSETRLEELLDSLLQEIRAHRAETLKAEHLRAVWTDDRTWDAALTALGRRVKSKTGNTLVDVLYGVFKKVSLFFLLGMLVYFFGGWNAVAAMLKAMFNGGVVR